MIGMKLGESASNGPDAGDMRYRTVAELNFSPARTRRHYH